MTEGGMADPWTVLGLTSSGVPGQVPQDGRRGDWFSALVAEAGAEVLRRDDIARGLARTDRVSQQSLEQDILRAAGVDRELREQFAAAVAEVGRLDERKRAVLTEQLPTVTQLLEAAEAAEARAAAAGSVAGLTSGQPLAPPRGRRRPRRWPRLGGRPGRPGRPGSAGRGPGEDIGYFAAAVQRQRAMADRDEAVREAEIPELAEIETLRAGLLAGLSGQLADALTLKVNQAIDEALAASYEREFSYLGSPRLAGQPSAASQASQAGQAAGEVNREAVRTVRAMIDGEVGGAVGVAGPRGIGKSTLLARFATSAFGPVWTPGFYGMSLPGGQQRLRWGVCVAAPAQYDTRDFLLHLFGRLCAEVLGEDRVSKIEADMTGGKERPGRRPLPRGWLVRYAGLAVLLCAAAVVGLRTARPADPGRPMTDLLIAGCCAALAVATGAVSYEPLRVWAGAPRPNAMFARTPDRFETARKIVIAAACLIAAALSAVVAAGWPVAPGYLAAAALVAAAGAFRLLAPAVERMRRPAPAAGAVIMPSELTPARIAAERWYRVCKFQQSYTTGWSGTVTLAPPVVSLQAQRSGGTAVTPVSLSVPEIVAGFKSFTAVLRESPGTFASGFTGFPYGAPAAGQRGPTPVVIGIDEVDKIEDPQAAQAFFNQIKGLFGDTGCLFLVSISDDALAAYERRGLPLRDAFDSSLTSVVTLSYASRDEARALIGGRLVGITEPSADLLYVLSGGLPRELVRLIRRAVEVQSQASGDGRAPAPVPLDVLAAALISSQAAAQRRAVLIRGGALEPCPARDALLAWAGSPPAPGPDGQPRDEAGEPADYFGRLYAEGAKLTGACAGDVPRTDRSVVTPTGHRDRCAATETGVFLCWLATVGQVFGRCRTAAEFEDAERPGGDRSFDRLARARQSFPLGPDYVDTAVRAVRAAWDL